MKKYVRLDNGNIFICDENEIPNNAIFSDNIMDLFKIGDIVRIEYFSVRDNKRVKTLFLVDNIIGDRYYIRLESTHMTFIVTDSEFILNDVEKYNPVIKSIIPIEMIPIIEQELYGNNNIRK